MPSTELYFYILDLVGVLAFALSGNLLASRQNIDLTGGIVLGMLTATGGGIARDLILSTRPAAFEHPVYLLIPIAAGVIVYLIGPRVVQAERGIVFFDAIGLGVFVVIGTTKALHYGMPILSAILLGLMTGVGGGMLRDVFANRVPVVFQSSDLYVIPAVVGAAVTAGLYQIDLITWWAEVGVIAMVTVFRLLSLRFGWRAPSSMRSWSVRPITRRALGRTRAPGRREEQE
ncbi:trimeric intracellular cation channel family protein [Brevibacterium sp. HMSC07C04]|uniref:trimeric intracellular cation channel family protein n=1 Tax=Brevibacterium sp. HMSC07C04 TaxID=1581130 RepID=UPI0008A17846|nr:trimeric intracellular cation channel family protein [Brevibacterium sp. HMSC07C04]OFS27621.1 hypothetical protein HMPREF3162_01505 [Brevibacterium sp. HMSC07C04]